MSKRRIPSLLSLSDAFNLTPSQAGDLRRALQSETVQSAMSNANHILGGFGVEYIPAGHNRRSPWIEYVNQGDTYATTLLCVGPNGHYIIGSWGAYVEKGNYS